ncbi:MAG: response regulator [Deltaproteobacteria bacterium]|nr:response regulator [Deltaproteobacteria bacterium]MDQ3297562.1 response regulator [Myxococcota bacterium]
MAVPSDHDIIMALGEDLPVGIWVARAPGGEEVYANRTFRQILGVGTQQAEVGGYSVPYGIFTRHGERYPEQQLPFVRALQERQVVISDDITIHRPDGTRVDVRAFARPVNEPITHVIVAFFDITREVEAERARAESDHRLQRAQRLEAVGTLAGGIAHDFNNLIFGIKLIAAELATTESDPKRKSAFALIDDITERSATLTRSLLGFARLGKHRAMPVSLDHVVAAMTELLRRALGGVSLEFELFADNGGVVLGDQSQLEQVVMNLVLNARDAVASSGRVVVRTRTVTLDAAPPRATGMAGEGRHVVLEVADDGPGIPDSIRDRVFEPYFTTKNQGSERGTGLGLATVLGIVETHGGSCEVDEGLDGRGTTLRVYLPIANARPMVPATRGHAPVQRGTGMVLVVDDDPIVRRALALAMSSIGYHVAEAQSGTDAVEIYREHKSELRVVLLDMVMPTMNGRATYLALREIDPDVRVILMSGYTLNEEVQEILDLGVKAFVSKPYSIETLARALAQVLEA